jgi:hypothetical protein
MVRLHYNSHANEKLKKKKGEGFPLQAWSGSWGSRRLRLLDFLDFRHYEGGKVITLMHRPPSPPVVKWEIYQIKKRGIWASRKKFWWHWDSLGKKQDEWEPRYLPHVPLLCVQGYLFLLVVAISGIREH